MKRINTTKLVALLAALCLMTSAFVGSTLAKYTTSGTGTATARVAKWDIDFGTGDSAATSDLTSTFTFDLFEYTDTGVTTDETVIAPGTTGSFAFSLNNKSEVKAAYDVEFTATSTAVIPIEYSLDGNTWDDDITTLNITNDELSATDEKVTVYWQWAFDGDDVTDTALGVKGTDTVTVAAKVTVNQLDQ